MRLPLSAGTQQSPVDPQPHAINAWGHARAMLTDKVRMVETPNTETLYSLAVVDLAGGPVVVVHPDLGERYFRTSLWELHGDTHTISQKQDGSSPAVRAAAVRLAGGPPGRPERHPGAQPLRRHRPSRCPVYGENDVANVTALQDPGRSGRGGSGCRDGEGLLVAGGPLKEMVVVADRSRGVLPIPERKHVGVTTYDAKDPDTSFAPIVPLRPPPGAPNVLGGFGMAAKCVAKEERR